MSLYHAFLALVFFVGFPGYIIYKNLDAWRHPEKYRRSDIDWDRVGRSGSEVSPADIPFTIGTNSDGRNYGRDD